MAAPEKDWEHPVTGVTQKVHVRDIKFENEEKLPKNATHQINTIENL